MLTIKESGMKFGEYSEDRVFQIENSDTQRMANSPPVVEFIYTPDDKRILFIEAKSSSPREETSRERYQEFISEIADKFICSFDMYIASKFKRYPQLSDMDNRLNKIDDSVSEIQFYLVINGHRKDWLPPLQAEFERKLINHKKIWKTKVVVINDEIAEKMRLVYK